MSRDAPQLQHRLAIRLVRHAGKVLPPNREHWADAMAAELAHIPENAAALKWAVGCVVAGYSERIKAMTNLRPGISRWVLSLEMLICLAPLTLAFVLIMFNLKLMSGRDAALDLSVALVGPIGSVAAFKAIALNRPALPAATSWALSILAAWTLLAYGLHILDYSGGAIPALDWWREFILLALLPALAVAHLIFLAKRSAYSDVSNHFAPHSNA
jgi:hypothetical protein